MKKTEMIKIEKDVEIQIYFNTETHVLHIEISCTYKNKKSYEILELVENHMKQYDSWQHNWYTITISRV